MGPVQGQPGGPDDSPQRAASRHPAARRDRADDERRRRHVDPLDDAELALPAVELQDPRRSRRSATAPNAIPKDSTSIDWPFDYAELEPYYDKHEYFAGVSGQAGNVQRHDRPPRQHLRGAAAAPVSAAAAAPARLDGLTDAAAKGMGWHPYPGPAGIRSQAYHGKAGCTYCGFCGWTGCYTDAKVSDERGLHPAGREDEEPDSRPAGATCSGRGRQPGTRDRRALPEGRPRVLPAGQGRHARRLHVRERPPAAPVEVEGLPNGLSNNHGQVGKHYIAHGLGSAAATGLFPGKRLNRYSGTIGQFTAVDDLDADNFDHTGLGFIGGGMAAPRWRRSRSARRTRPAERPALGIGLEGVARTRTPTRWPGWRAARGAVLRGQLPRPRPGRPRPPRPAGDPDHDASTTTSGGSPTTSRRR